MLRIAQKVRIQKWIRMLRSGEFKQGRDKLKKDGKYCCLGVACELYSVERGGFWKRAVEYSGDPVRENYFVADYTTNEDYPDEGGEDTSCTELPNAVRNWLGLSHHDVSTLISMNDNLDMSFEEIARELERHLTIHEDREDVNGLGL